MYNTRPAIKHIITVGACYVDTILTVDHYPEEDEKLRSSAFSRRRGGNCPNALEVLRQFVHSEAVKDHLRCQMHLVTVLPHADSAATKMIIDGLSESSGNVIPSITFDGCQIRYEHQEPASAYIIKSLATTSRTIVNYNPLPDMTLEEFQRRVEDLRDKWKIENAWYHFEGRIPDATLQFISWLQQAQPDSRISVEVENPSRIGLELLAAHADVIFYSKSWAVGKGYATPDECLTSQMSTTKEDALLCCTWGKDGAVAAQKINGRLTAWEQVNAWLSDQSLVKDTIGAGDTFVAGMLFGLVCRSTAWNLQKKLAFANELAGRKIIQEGFLGLGDMMKVEQWLNESSLND